MELPFGDSVRSTTSRVPPREGLEKLNLSPAWSGPAVPTLAEFMSGSIVEWLSLTLLLGEAPERSSSPRSFDPCLEVAKSSEMVFWG